MAKGWIVEVTYAQAGGKVRQRFDVAISDPEEAVAAVKRLLAPAVGINVAVVEELFDATFYGLGLSPGDILPRLRYRR